MKRFLIICIVFIGLSLGSMANPVDLETAMTVAAKFMGTEDLQLSATYRTESDAAALYVFNTTDGFVIVAADDCETPIIGYSHEGRFDPNNVPVQMEAYLQDFVARIQYGIENHIEADEVTAKQWASVKATGRLTDSKVEKTVPALLTSIWHQGCLYNSLCPAMSGPCDHAEAGCVAVAMGQIMRYWGYPTTGWGSTSYVNAGVTLSADFGNTVYDWELMPDSLTDQSTEAEINAVATLLFHCGVSVNMYYTVNGSTANTNKIANAMTTYFNYSSQLHLEKRASFDDEEWLSLLKQNLDSLHPVLYFGSGNSGGHAFVCDGYDDSDLLHFNWGWGVANGYFALGNLNPLGYTFNKTNSAILDIVPHYAPCLVEVTAYPSTAGTIEGAGEYPIGSLCTLVATPTEDYYFYHWEKDGQFYSNEPTITFDVKDDTIHFEAIFSCYPVGQITASYAPDANNPAGPDVSLSWSHDDTEWTLLKQFEIGEEIGGMATDGEHIYITYAEWNDPPFLFGKYTMDGELLERFNIEGLPKALCLAYDGNSFYTNCGHSGLSVLYRIDLENKMILDSTDMGVWFGTVTYDPDYDGFWLGRNYQSILYSRQGQMIRATPTTYDYLYGTAYYTTNDGNPHLILSREHGVYDYDINNDYILDRPLLDFGEEINTSEGTCFWRYHDTDALYIVINEVLYIYDISSTQAQIPQISNYRIYRADSEGNTVLLADDVTGTGYTDTTWDMVSPGVYKFGISSVYANGNESEIIWSEPIVKSGYGVEENDVEIDITNPVQKVFENGQIIIIKDGKRYNLQGQHLN